MNDETLTEALARALATADGYEKPDWSTVVLARALLPIVREAERTAARDALDAFVQHEIEISPDTVINADPDEGPYDPFEDERLTYLTCAQATAWNAKKWADEHYPDPEEER